MNQPCLYPTETLSAVREIAATFGMPVYEAHGVAREIRDANTAPIRIRCNVCGRRFRTTRVRHRCGNCSQGSWPPDVGG